MDAKLLEIQEALAKEALLREHARLAAHEQAMKELGEARAREEARQASAREEQDAARQRKVEKVKAAQEAEAERLREEAELRRITEQEENLRQEALDNIIRMKENIKRRMDELEHAEEQAKKALRDVILQMEPKDDSERIVPNPLQKFLQTAPE